jgi:secondary thiamine-phosphate synthase enzyme
LHQSLTRNSFSKILDYHTRQKLEFINLTATVEELVAESGIRDGFAVVQSLHSTAGLFVNEWQDALLEDFRALLDHVVPEECPWRHNDPRYSDCDRGNGASHLRAALSGSSATLAVRDGRLVRGVWQSIILVEFDGPRTRSVSVQVVGG